MDTGFSRVCPTGAARRLRFTVQGRVQGVGFRPFVFTLAEDTGLTGFVRNTPEGVVIEVQGQESALAAFTSSLENRLPPLARITAMQQEECPLLPGEQDFSIAESTAGESHAVLISPDTATCPDCLEDIGTAANRRFHYPFTNCTNCGPRYSITRSIPYDRATTSMACFPMCPECRREYENPRDRRFHAQPNACPICGPEVSFVTAEDTGKTPDSSVPDARTGMEALRALAAFLAEGGIAAIKGLGGFHLACDACNEDAVSLLRLRKHRPHKPLAVMAADVATARKFAHIDHETGTLLSGPEHPVVVCPLLPEAQRCGFARNISPDTFSVGIMLPYTPLHSILFRLLSRILPSSRPLVLVMTSGNPGGEPICLGNREARKSLDGMADAFLFHNRDILIRVDDSVIRPLPGQSPLFLRRARGYVPGPAGLSPLPAGHTSRCLLGVGAELKNTLCLNKGDDAFVSQHIGDMANLETTSFHGEIRDHLMDLLKVAPEAVVRDLHPDYLSGRLADDWAQKHGLPVLQLQHHFAHAHAVLAENGFSDRALVLALDGTGLGNDGQLWGGEALFVDASEETLKEKGRPIHKRLASFAPMDLPGGEAAIREPWRIAHALLLRLGLPMDVPGLALPWLPEHTDAAAVLPLMLQRRLNCPVSTSCGRLFDAVSALLGLCTRTSYEGQAAIRLEEAQSSPPGNIHEARPDTPPGIARAPGGLYSCSFGKTQRGDGSLLELDTHSLFASVYEDRLKGTPVALIAQRFHTSLAAGLLDLVRHLATELDIRHIGLSGGSMQNATLATLLTDGLEQSGYIPLTHKVLPPNDACISLGQVAWGRMLTLPS